jgi:hypothetical protein
VSKKHHLIRFRVENVMRLSAFFLEPPGNVIVLGGKNGAGKSCALHAIAMLIGGKKFCPAEPIRHGQDSATIEGETEHGLRLKREFRRKGDSYTSALTVRTAEGAAVSQTRLSEMVGGEKGRRIFDPLAFLRLSDSDQVDALLDASGKRPELELLEQRRQAAYDRRRDTNRDLKKARAAYETLPVPPEGTPAQIVAMGDELIAKIREGNRAAADRDQARRDLEKAEHEKYVLTSRIGGLRDELAAKLAEISRTRVLLADAPADDDDATADLELRLTEIEETNRFVRGRLDREKQHDFAARLEQLSEELTAQIEAATAGKAEVLASVDLPVEGLGFGAGVLTYGDAPLSQASRGQQIWIATALALCRGPEFAIVTIQDGSLLDAETWADMETLAEEFGAQIWIEDTRATGDRATVVVEDGEIPVLSCDCAHAQMDTLYDLGMRTHVPLLDGSGLYRCTVCGATRPSAAHEGEED